MFVRDVREEPVRSDEPRLAVMLARWTVLADEPDDPRLLESVESDLRDPRVDLDCPFDYLRRLTDEQRQEQICRSVDTTTHLKLSLDQNRHRGLRAWLHVYKPWDRARDRHAASVHDHRYSFVSKILSGGYREEHWTVRGEPRVTGSQSFSAGEVHVVGVQEVHSLSEVADGTITLVVQLPTTRWFSTVYQSSARGGGVGARRIVDIESHLDRLLVERPAGPLAERSPYVDATD